MDEIARHHAHVAKLEQLGKHWHQKLWYGSGPWAGDRFLNIYSNKLTDDIEVRYEVPNEKPQMVFQIPLADFDIDKLCAALAKADDRATTVQEKIEEVDAHNDAKEAADAAVLQEHQDATIEKVHWALRKDTGAHIAPLQVPEHSVLD